MKKLIIVIFLLTSCGDGGANELQELAVTSTTNNTTSSTNQEVASQDKEELKSECPLDEEKRFKIEIINESLNKTNLGLFFYINSLFNPLEENIKTQCVGINEINTFKFDFDMNNPPNTGRFGAGTENWYDICYQPKKDLFLSEEKITFLFSDDEIKITSELIYDRIIDRETGLVTFSKDDDSKPNKYCDNVDLNTSLPSTTTTTTLPENVVIEFENCIESIKDDAPFKLEFVIYAGNNDIDDITVFQKFLNNEYTESFRDSGLDLPVRGSYSGYYNSYDLKTLQANNWIKEFKVTVKTKSGSITTKTCKQTVIVTNPVTTTTTTAAPTTTTTAAPTTTTTAAPTTTTTAAPVNLYPDTPSSSSWISFYGSGDTVVDVSSIGDELKIGHFEHSGSSNFIVVGYDSNFDRISSYVNEIGQYSGDIPINFDGDIVKTIEVTANGSWEIIIKPIASAMNFDSNFISGTGDTVIEAYELKNSRDSLTLTHSGSSNFIVTQFECNGDRNYSLVNEIGSYSGQQITDRGTCFIRIYADGNWTISK